MEGMAQMFSLLKRYGSKLGILTSNDLVEKKYPLWIADIDYETIKNFCLEHKDIYIYE